MHWTTSRVKSANHITFPKVVVSETLYFPLCLRTKNSLRPIYTKHQHHSSINAAMMLSTQFSLTTKIGCNPFSNESIVVSVS